MQKLNYQKNQLHIESVDLAAIAEQYGTPCYVYSQQALEHNWQEFEQAFGDRLHQICYAVKANANLAILNFFAQKNSGFDIVSVGELERVLLAKGDPKKIIFSGVAKLEREILRAIEVGVGCFNIESESELIRLHEIAIRIKKIVNIALRINPNIDAKTHPYIATGLKDNKFGIDSEDALALCQKIQKDLPYCKLIGIGCHIGSQLTELNPFLEAIDKVLELVNLLKKENIILEHIDMGGGLGVCYHQETPPSIRDYITALCQKLASYSLEIIIEPGRALVANTGVLLTRIEYLKHTRHKNFAIVDAGMNDLLRPALYDAWHSIIPVTLDPAIEEKNYDIVGPVCESSDFLGKNRMLAVKTGDLLVIDTVGAYGACMSSNYNARPRAAEVMVNHNKTYLIRRRETLQDLVALESM